MKITTLYFECLGRCFDSFTIRDDMKIPRQKIIRLNSCFVIDLIICNSNNKNKMNTSPDSIDKKNSISCFCMYNKSLVAIISSWKKKEYDKRIRTKNKKNMIKRFGHRGWLSRMPFWPSTPHYRNDSLNNITH